MKISVVVPVYNAERYLRKCLDSLCRQTFVNYEVICVDDGSSDASFFILQEYEKKDSKFVILQHLEKSDGAAAARNIGMCAAKGEYLAFMDADDYAEPDMLEVAYKRAIETKADITMFDAWYFDDDEEVDFAIKAPLRTSFLPPKDIFSPKDYPELVFNMTHGTVWGRLFKREFIVKHELKFYDCHYWDDIEFWYVAMCLADKIAICHKRLMHYRWNAGGNQTSTISNYPEIAYKATMEIKRRFIEKGIYEHYRVPLMNHLIQRIFSILHRINNKETFDSLFFALKDQYLEEIGAYELTDEEYDGDYFIRCRNLIRDSADPEEYLLRKNTMYVGAGEKRLAKVAKATGGNKNILLYGAGVKGRAMFGTLLGNEPYRVVSWVDRDWKNIGFPIEDPQKISQLVFDIVIISIESEKTANKVKEYLIEQGVPEEKIVWMY